MSEEGDPLDISERTGYGTSVGKICGLVYGCNEGIKLGLSDIEIPGTTLGAAEGFKHGYEEG